VFAHSSLWPGTRNGAMSVQADGLVEKLATALLCWR
jgi:hypothetical protein